MSKLSGKTTHPAKKPATKVFSLPSNALLKIAVAVQAASASPTVVFAKLVLGLSQSRNVSDKVAGHLM